MYLKHSITCAIQFNYKDMYTKTLQKMFHGKDCISVLPTDYGKSHVGRHIVSGSNTFEMYFGVAERPDNVRLPTRPPSHPVYGYFSNGIDNVFTYIKTNAASEYANHCKLCCFLYVFRFII